MNKWTAFSEAHPERFVDLPGGGMVQLFNPHREHLWQTVYAEYREQICHNIKANDTDFFGATHWKPLSDPPEGA